MNLHRRCDTPLGPPVCLRLADRMGAAAKRVRTGGSFWSRNKTPPLRNHHAGQRPRRLLQSAGMEVDDNFGYDWGARAPRVLVLASKRTSDDLIFDSGLSR